MRITAVTERTIAIASNVRSASMSLGGMTASVLAIHTDASRDGKPLVGLAFDSIGRYGHGGLLRERFIPRLTAADPDDYADGTGGIDPQRVWTIAMRDEKPGGHGERCGAVGLIDAAVWDLAAKAAGEPLWHTLARHGNAGANGTIALYASGGHYRAENDVALLCEDVRRAIDRGHRRFKIKIGGAPLDQDVRRIEALLASLSPGMTLAVDGNGAFPREVALRYLAALSAFPLAWIEEPVAPLDYDLHREIAAASELPLATGENIFSLDDARNLLRHGGLRRDRDLLQFDVSLSYGIVEYLRILEAIEHEGWTRARCAPHAGHLLAAHCVAGLGLGLAEVAMDETTLFGRITAELSVEAGTARLPDAPGAGFETLSAFGEIFSGVLH
jgi:L-alanine-DL-glutamate epimerase-like enolase superfamily enzyme